MAKIGRGLPGQSDDVLPRRHAGDWSGQNVIEHQSRYGELCQRPAHRLLDDAVDAASREHRARLDVHGSDGVGEEHHTENEPRRRAADGFLGDAADVESRRAEIVQHYRCRSPERDERQHHGCSYHYPDSSLSVARSLRLARVYSHRRFGFFAATWRSAAPSRSACWRPSRAVDPASERNSSSFAFEATLKLPHPGHRCAYTYISL